MTSVSDAPSTAQPTPTRPKRRRFWLIEFLLSPFTDTDDRVHYTVTARAARRNGSRSVTFKNAAAPVHGKLPVRRFTRDGE